MKFAARLGTVVLVAISASALHADDAKDIEGMYNIEVMMFRGENAPPEALKNFQVTIAGNKMTMPGDSMVTIKLDSGKKPKEVDFDENGKVNYGIYSLEDDVVQFCFTTEGTDRPKTFDSPVGSTIFYLKLKKQ